MISFITGMPINCVAVTHRLGGPRVAEHVVSQSGGVVQVRK